MNIKPNYISLPNSERKVARGARLIAPSDPNERLEVSIRLRRKASPKPAVRKGHLTYEELGDSYGAEQADLDKVAAFAQQHHLAVVESNAAKRTVKLSGTVKDFSEAFDVHLGHYERAASTYRGRTGPIRIPKELEGIIAGVFGLDNRPFAHPHFKAFKPRADAAAGQFNGLSPLQVAKLYGFPDGDGSGQTIGIIELGGGFRPSDLQTYFSVIGVNPNPTVLVASVDHGANSPGADADLEVGLDIEIAGAIAPKAKIVVYFAPSTSDVSFGDAILDAVHDTANNPSVISISWGGPEDGATGQFIQDVNSALEDAQHLGITVLVASGDNGAADMGPAEWDHQAHVDFPSSSPLVLACGATRIDPSGTTLQGEAAWNQGFADTQDDSFGSVGGGISDVNGVPSWQQNLTMPRSANGGGPGRGVPDVTGNGDPNSGYKVLVDGKGTVVGGTSAVAPLWAGLIARINQNLGARVGFVNPILYATPAAFNDVKLQNNRVSSQGGSENLGYDAAPGWDACSGLGSPIGGAVQAALKQAAATVAVQATVAPALQPA